MRKVIYILLVMVVLSGLASGMSFGSYVSTNEKQVDGRSAEFTINMMNLGEEKLNVEINSRNTETGTITTPSEVPLPPSQTSENPEKDLGDDEEWLLLSDGEYVKTKKVPVVFVANEAGNHEFRIDLNAEVSGNQLPGQIGSDYSTAQKVVQSRSYTFEVSRSSNPSGGNEAGNTAEGTSSETGTQTESSSISSDPSGIVDRARDLLNQDSDSSSQESQDQQANEEESDQTSSEEDELDDVQQESSSSPDNNRSEPASSSATGGFFEQTSSNPVTTVLLLGVMASIGYLVTVIA